MNWRKSRKFKAPGRAIFAGLLLLSVRAGALEPAHLPIYLEDSHAGSFYWFAENLPLDEEVTLVLVDAHSDASELFDSDAAYRALRGTADRATLLKKWRERGLVQCFDWIEPLMPKPFKRVIWVAPDDFDLEKCRAEIDREIHAHDAAVPRKRDSLDGRFEVVKLAQLADAGIEGPVVVSLDLDYFAECDPAVTADSFSRLWDRVFELPKLRAITAAISTPYLQSQKQADLLVSLFLEHSLAVANAKIRWEPFEITGPDRSRRAKDLMRRGEQVPAFEWENASERLRSLVAAYRGRTRVERERDKWEEATAGWGGPSIYVPGHRADEDGCVRVRKNSEWEVRLADCRENESISWKVLTSRSDMYNLLGSGTRLAGDAPRWIRWEPVPVGGDRPWLSEGELKPFLDAETGWGTVRVEAKCGDRRAGEIVIRVSEEEGFRGAIQEAFQLPYVLGGSRLADRGLTGSDLALGGDCANLAVYGLRRSQQDLKWMIPREFRALTEEIEEFSPEDLRRGVFVDLGTHLAVLMKDLPPLGRFNGADFVAHHLEGRPELIPLERLLEDRRKPRFCRLRIPEDAITICIAGDTMLARTVGDSIGGGEDPFREVSGWLKESDLAVVNLECGITGEKIEAGGKKPFFFSAPVRAAELLSEAGVGWVSMANNHATDVPVAETLGHLRGAGVAPFGCGESEAAVSEVGIKVALVGWQPGNSFDAISDAAGTVDFVVVMPHWGTEYQREVDEAQIVAAREMVTAGADLIVGAGPHCVQKSDCIGGVPVYYSLGNFVFDEDGPNEDWKNGRAIRVTVSRLGNVLVIDEMQIRIDERGFPKMPNQ